MSRAPNTEAERAIDTRDLAILDAMRSRQSLEEVAEQFGMVESYIRELWRVREAQAPVGERA